MSLADALTYAATYALWLEGDGCHDRPDNRAVWVQRPPEERVALVERLLAGRAKVVALKIHRGPRDHLLAARKERG